MATRSKTTMMAVMAALAGVWLCAGCADDDGPVGGLDGGADLGVVADLSPDGGPAPDVKPAPDTGPAPGAYGQRCDTSKKGTCASGLTCLRISGQSSMNGYCAAKCSSTQKCPSSPAGGQCLLSGTSVKYCAFACAGANPHCPNGLGCTYLPNSAMYLCTGDPQATCGNGKLEAGEACDGTLLDNLNCKAFGHTGGKLSCSSKCAFDTSSCTGGKAVKLPALACTDGKSCSKLEAMTPRTGGDGFKVYTLAQWSYLRRDTFSEVKYAAAAVNQLMPGSWPISLADGSNASGTTPKSSSGSYRHPPSSHVNGIDIDIAYYQTGTKDNDPRPVCPYKSSLGKDVNQCVGAPDSLDARRSAFLLARMCESGRIRAMGVDGFVGPVLRKEAATLYTEGLITKRAHDLMKLRMVWETTNKGQGWYYSHHNHVHISTVWVYYHDQTTTGAQATRPQTPDPAWMVAKLPKPQIILPDVR